RLRRDVFLMVVVHDSWQDEILPIGIALQHSEGRAERLALRVEDLDIRLLLVRLRAVGAEEPAPVAPAKLVFVLHKAQQVSSERTGLQVSVPLRSDGLRLCRGGVKRIALR